MFIEGIPGQKLRYSWQSTNLLLPFLAPIVYLQISSFSQIGHLAYVEDQDIATVLSWHMMGDMDCLITFTSAKVSRTMIGCLALVAEVDYVKKKHN